MFRASEMHEGPCEGVTQSPARGCSSLWTSTGRRGSTEPTSEPRVTCRDDDGSACPWTWKRLVLVPC